MEYKSPQIIVDWKNEQYRCIKAKAKGLGIDVSKEKVMKYLDKKIAENVRNPRVTVVNNYSNQTVRTDLLSLIDVIEQNRLIVGGGGCLYVQHGARPNLLLDFIKHVMEQRAFYKKERKKYEDGTYEYAQADLSQLLQKLIINSLYGCLGYPGFPMYNVFLAESITNSGKNIICTAINAFENFLGDAMYFDTPGELFHFIFNADREYKDRWKDVDYEPYRVDNILYRTVNRLAEKCTFTCDQKLKDQIEIILNGMSERELTILYYKNNLMAFLKTPKIKKIVHDIIKENGELSLPYTDAMKTKDLGKRTMKLWDEMGCFVLYNYPVFDRLRKAMYRDKTRCLYTDTDSVFISLDHLVTYVQEDVFENHPPLDYDTLSFTVSNFFMIMLNIVVDKALKGLAYSMNITPEWAERLSMKNEFFFKKILFGDKKKRYASLALLQEGKILHDGKGKVNITGYDFKKSTTKPFLRDFFTKICEEDILQPAEIRPVEIWMKMAELKDMIENGIRTGDPKFFRQAAVKDPENYKNPFQNQGVTSILFWNALSPDYQLEFPNDVNIVPVVDLRWENKPNRPTPLANPNVKAFSEKYPEDFKRLNNEIYLNPNPEIAHMAMRYIALPKNPEIPIPDSVYDIIDYDKIVRDSTGLFIPIMQSIGIKSFNVDSTTSVISNIVEL